ncbi:MAG: YceI family protein [Bacteroidia bacterium]|nr:YceI family protein [Bacteroidia bacterium]
MQIKSWIILNLLSEWLKKTALHTANLRFSLIFLLLFKTTVFAQTIWKVEPTSEIKFTIKNMGVSVEGKFKNFVAHIKFDPDHLDQSEIEGIVYANSIDTDISARDRHLRDEEYFYVAKYPQITFKSAQIFKHQNYYIARGTLTMKNVKKEILIPFYFTPNQDNKARFSSSFSLNRLDYNVGGKSLMLSNDVNVKIEIQATK